MVKQYFEEQIINCRCKIEELKIEMEVHQNMIEENIYKTGRENRMLVEDKIASSKKVIKNNQKQIEELERQIRKFKDLLGELKVEGNPGSININLKLVEKLKEIKQVLYHNPQYGSIMLEELIEELLKGECFT